jgi:helix-turn-helix protein
MKTSDPEQLLTCSEVAELLHLHPKTVERWARAGKLPCVRRFYETFMGIPRRLPSLRVADGPDVRLRK